MENENINRKDAQKEKIILFVIGVLVGAVISAAAFFVYVKTLGTGSATSGSSLQQMPGGGTPPEMPSGQNQGGTPPEMPSGQNGSSSQGGTPPEKPSDDNNSESNS